MKSKINSLCVCSCGRKPMDQIHFDNYNKGKHCEKCGEKFRLIMDTITRVLVLSEQADCYDEYEAITVKEFKKLLGIMP